MTEQAMSWADNCCEPAPPSARITGLPAGRGPPLISFPK